MYFGQATGYQNQSGPIVEYDRRIRYLDYMENGQRSRGAGFVKMERRNNHCNISLQVSGLYRKDHFTRPLLMLTDGEEKELCKLQLADGGIKIYLEGLDCKNMDGQGLEYERLAGLRIPISEGKEILCIWDTKMSSRMQDTDVQGTKVQDTDVQDTKVQDTDVQDTKVQDAKMQDTDVQKENVQNKSAQNINVQNEKVQNEKVQNENMRHNQSNLNVPIQEVATWDLSRRNENVRETPAQEEILEVQEVQMPQIRIQETHIPEKTKTPESPIQPASKRQANLTVFKEDKWEQLWSVYPHIHPFSDEREYLSFGLSDFVVLPARYYKLVNNSFLLHGFYNFHHLILTRVNTRNGARYFIGVPGNLYQTERETAIMFGFENFECDREPAGKGDFGYYLIPVEL